VQYYISGNCIAGRYEVVQGPREKHSLLGGMGVVYVCLDLEEDRPVALKTFRPEYLPDRAARDRFLREGTHWVDLGAHPHIVRCYEVFRTDPEVFLVLELVAKEQGREDASLRSWLTPGVPLPVERALLFGLQIARGMQHAVETIPGFVHRDLKPENVLVGADRMSDDRLSGDRLSGGVAVNRLRVTDFGLAAALEEVRGQGAVVGGQGVEGSTSLGRTQLTRGVVGTPLYMAPEQWAGEAVSTATDVYALGCILYEMLAGQCVVAGSNLDALQRAHCQGNLRPLSAGIAAVVSQVVARCLALEPGQRYRSWGGVEAAITDAYRALTGRPAPGAEAAAALSREERVTAGWSFNAMGASYLDLGKAEVAAGYFRRAGAVGKEEGEHQLAAAALGNLGLAFADLGDAHRAIGCYEQQLVTTRKIGDRRGEGNALGDLGNAYHQLGDARRAIGYYEQYLEIARQIGDRRGEGNALGNLGIAYAGLGDPRRAIGFYEQQLVITREIGDRRGEGTALGNLGIAYKNLGDARCAIGYYEQALSISREIGDRRGEAQDLGNLGNVYANLGDARRAIGYYEQCLTIHREVGDAMGLALDSFNLADEYRELGEQARALELAQEAARLFAEMGHAPYAQQAQALVAQLQGHGPAAPADSIPGEILESFAPLIAAAVAAAGGNRAARAQVEGAFDALTQNGWQIVDPIRRIWAGERDEAALTAGLDRSDSLIVREILEQLAS
jgi:tetratricopeptide (TPR) repeat protein